MASTVNGTEEDPNDVELNIAMLKLGTLLLEIWHKTTLERRFSLREAPHAYDGGTTKIVTAADWLDDVDELLPDLYNNAVAHCLRGYLEAIHSPLTGMIPSYEIRSPKHCQATLRDTPKQWSGITDGTWNVGVGVERPCFGSRVMAA